MGRGLIFSVFQIYYPESVVVYAKMKAPARIFIYKRDTIRWKISLDIKGVCSRVEFREMGGVGPDSIITDSIPCVVKSKKFGIFAEIMDYNAGKSLKRIKLSNLKNKNDLYVSSLIYDYTEEWIVLKVRLYSAKEKEIRVRFAMRRQWEEWKYFDYIRVSIRGDTLVVFHIPRKYMSFGNVRFEVDVDGIKRETEVLFNEFNIENDKDFDIMLSVLSFVFGKRSDILKGKRGKERLKAWEEFWEKMGGDRTMEEFLDRLYVAVQKYPSNIRSKISDRALVYTKFGEPDEIASYPYRLEGKPYEIWYYHRLGLRFVFVDFDGTGDYRLVPESYLELLR